MAEEIGEGSSFHVAGARPRNASHPAERRINDENRRSAAEMLILCTEGGRSGLKKVDDFSH